MGISTPVLAAIIGSLVAGVISFIVNVISLGGQYVLNKKNRREMKEFQWKRETTSILRELRREALRMDLNNGDAGVVNNLIEEIESQIDLIPSKFKDSDTNSNLDDILLTYHDFDTETNDMTVVDYRSELIEKTEDALESFENSG